MHGRVFWGVKNGLFNVNRYKYNLGIFDFGK